MTYNNKKRSINEKQELHLLCFSFYNLDYGIGASASFLDQLNSLPNNVTATVIEPNRVDLPRTDIDLSSNIRRVIVPLPLSAFISTLLFPFLAFFYGLTLVPLFRPSVVFSMHQPFHFLSVTGSILSKILQIPHVVDLHDVWRPMGLKLRIIDLFQDNLERITSHLIKKDLLLFICTENKQILELRTNLKFKHTLVLPNCVSDNLVKDIQRKTQQENVINFIFVGRIGKEYALDKIQNVFDKLISLGYEPHLNVVGHDQVGVPSFATFIGSLPRRETLKLIAESDVGIGPLGPTIAIPRKVVEYLALGKIVVVGKNAVSRDTLNEFGESILEISDTTDVTQIVTKLLVMLKNVKYNPEKISALYCQRKMRTILDYVLSKQNK